MILVVGGTGHVVTELLGQAGIAALDRENVKPSEPAQVARTGVQAQPQVVIDATCALMDPAWAKQSRRPKDNAPPATRGCSTPTGERNIAGATGALESCEPAASLGTWQQLHQNEAALPGNMDL